MSESNASSSRQMSLSNGSEYSNDSNVLMNQIQSENFIFADDSHIKLDFAIALKVLKESKADLIESNDRLRWLVLERKEFLKIQQDKMQKACEDLKKYVADYEEQINIAKSNSMNEQKRIGDIFDIIKQKKQYVEKMPDI